MFGRLQKTGFYNYNYECIHSYIQNNHFIELAKLFHDSTKSTISNQFHLAALTNFRRWITLVLAPI